jgi:4-hydroxy-tetrahydrodipicolinate reductase
MIKLVVAGCAGRMGKLISTLAIAHKNIQLVGGFEFAGHPDVGKDIGDILGLPKQNVYVSKGVSGCIESADVVIDFTAPQATLGTLKTVVAHKKRMVIGTTGLSAVEEKEIATAAQSIPVVFAPNMSLGVNLLFKLSRMVAEVLSDEYDVEIVEAHHKHKKDAPSGTALELARQVAAGRKVELEKKALYGREGMCGAREKGSIGIHAVRGGDVVGEHTVSFLADGERIELTHKASSREAFAKGSLVAAEYIATKNKGLYSMQDVLGL